MLAADGQMYFYEQSFLINLWTGPGRQLFVEDMCLGFDGVGEFLLLKGKKRGWSHLMRVEGIYTLPFLIKFASEAPQILTLSSHLQKEYALFMVVRGGFAYRASTEAFHKRDRLGVTLQPLRIRGLYHVSNRRIE